MWIYILFWLTYSSEEVVVPLWIAWLGGLELSLDNGVVEDGGVR